MVMCNIILRPAGPGDGGGYTVTVPALRGCVTEGNTLEEAIAMPKDAIALYVEDLVAHGELVSEDDPMSQALNIRVETAAA